MQAATEISGRRNLAGDHSALAGLAIMAGTVVLGLIALFFTSDLVDIYPNVYLVPWLLGLAGVIALPMAFLYRKGRFTFVDPLVFATLSYIFPAFVIGGLFFALGISQPYFADLIQDQRETLPLTVMIVALGYAGLSLGYLLPIGSKVGGWISDWLPASSYSPDSHIIPGQILLFSGVMNTILTLVLGTFGYQRAIEFTSYDGLIFFTTLFWVQASFVLWYVVFKRRKWDLTAGFIVAVLLATSLVKFLFSGSRGNIIQLFLLITFAYILSGRRITVKQGAAAGILLTIGLTVGMIYGTTFRNVKGTEESQSVSNYTENVFTTVEQVGRGDMVQSLTFGAETFAARIDILSTLAVVVSNHEQLAPYEELYGLNDNIWIEMTTFMIPRVVWPGKPVVSDPRRYSDLYFDFGGSSYALTPFGDLLRNYGLPGVAIGMFLLGVVLRLIYRTLIEGQPAVIWRLTLYFMLLTSISYEGFYGTIIPTLFKIGVTALVGIVLVNFIAKRLDAGRKNLLRT